MRPIVIIILLLCLLSPIGAAEIRLTTDGTNKRDPLYIKGGQEIMYSYDETRALIRLMVMDAKELKPRPMFEDANKHQLNAAMSPDGKYIAFNECTGNLTAHFVIRHRDPRKDAHVKHGGRGGYRSPVFSPDSKHVFYCFAETGPQHIWRVTLDGKNKKQITEGTGVNNWPSFTPEGKTLVFGSSRTNTYEIYKSDVDGKNIKQLTHNKVMDIRPQVSPDGKRIVFTSVRDGNRELYMMDIEGKNVVRLTHHEERDDFATWHPDGKRIIYVGERRGRFDLYLLDVSAAPKTRAAKER